MEGLDVFDQCYSGGRCSSDHPSFDGFFKFLSCLSNRKLVRPVNFAAGFFYECREQMVEARAKLVYDFARPDRKIDGNDRGAWHHCGLSQPTLIIAAEFKFY